MRQKKVIKFSLAFLILVTIAFLVGFIINYSAIITVSKNITQITSENYLSELPNLNSNDYIELNGSVNFLNIVADSTEVDSAHYFYVGLKEYNNAFIVRVNKSKLISGPQRFSGNILRSSSIKSADALISEINSQIDAEFIDPTLPDTVQNQIATASEAQFNEDVFFLIDGEILESKQLVYTFLGIFFVTILLISFLFRKRLYSYVNN